jgi:hypothetical protein
MTIIEHNFSAEARYMNHRDELRLMIGLHEEMTKELATLAGAEGLKNIDGIVSALMSVEDEIITHVPSTLAGIQLKLEWLQKQDMASETIQKFCDYLLDSPVFN